MNISELESIGVDKKIIDGEKMITLLNYMDVYKNNYIDKNTASMQVSASDTKIKQCDCKQFDIFITPTSETREDIAHSAVALEDLPNTCYSYHLMRCRLKQPNKITASYLRYYFDSPRARQDFWKIAKGQTRFVISKYDVGKMVVPIPTLSRQHEIVEILDKFDTLVNDISKGLPREIELRKKQYEYYRGRLLRVA